MTTRQSRLLLTVTALVLAGASVLVVAANHRWPVEPPPSPTPPPAPVRNDAGRDASLPALASFEPLFRLKLRNPLVDAPPPAPPVETVQRPAKPPPLLRLIGTAIEPGRSVAIFASGLNAIELKAVGEKTAGGAEVIDITDRTAQVRYNNQTLTLKIAEPGEAPAGPLAVKKGKGKGRNPLPPEEPEEEDPDEEGEPEEAVEDEDELDAIEDLNEEDAEP